MEYKLAPLLPGEMYHLHNKANAGEKLFVTPENYRFFFEKYRHYISVIAHTYCYCLLPDNFHLLVRFKKEGELVDYFTKNRQYIDDFDKMITLQFSELFNSYSKEMHKKQNKKGDLFMPLLKRKKITDREYLKNVVYFIHHAPVDIGLTEEVYEYDHSSYNEIVSRNSRLLKAEEVLEWFEGVDGFTKFHQGKKELRINFIDEG
jgi:putative transposase